MKRIEKWLWITMSIIITLIILLIFVVSFDKKHNDVDNYVNEILDEKKNWVCYHASYYLEDGTEYKFAHDNMMLNFYDDYVEKCINGNCNNFTYNIDNDILIIDSGYLFEEKYIMKYENDVLILEENHEIGTKIIYYLSNPVG